MRILHMPQRSDEWFEEHLTRATASHAAEILDFTAKGVEGAKRRLYRMEKVAEVLSRIAVQDHYVSPAMRAGTVAEDPARRQYELEENVLVEQVGIIIADDERLAWSPDGLVGTDGAIEIKGPRTTTHLLWMTAGVIPEEHLPQLWMDFAVDPEIQWIDFVSRDAGMTNDKNSEIFGWPILPKRYVQFTIRAWRKDHVENIAKMLVAAQKFNADVDATVERIMGIAPETAQEPERMDFKTALERSAMLSDEDLTWAAENL